MYYLDIMNNIIAFRLGTVKGKDFFPVGDQNLGVCHIQFVLHIRDTDQLAGRYAGCKEILRGVLDDGVVSCLKEQHRDFDPACLTDGTRTYSGFGCFLAPLNGG